MLRFRFACMSHLDTRERVKIHHVIVKCRVINHHPSKTKTTAIEFVIYFIVMILYCGYDKFDRLN